MITYVLHGGNSRANTADNEKFFGYFSNLIGKQKIKILFCYWSRERERWGEHIELQKQKILTQASGKTIEFDLVENEDDLIPKLKEADVFYVVGGEEYLIKPYYQILSKAKKYLDGKVYIGSSMGVMIAVESFVLSLTEQEENKVFEGLGWLPIQVLCHWDIEQKKQMKLNLLDNHGKEPILVLDEGQSIIMCGI